MTREQKINTAVRAVVPFEAYRDIELDLSLFLYTEMLPHPPLSKICQDVRKEYRRLWL